MSNTFVLGSAEHKRAVQDLVDHHQSEYVEIEASGDRIWCTYPAVGSPFVLWCTEPIEGRFYKILDCTAFDKRPMGGAVWLRALHNTYTAYAAALDTTEPVPQALLPAELLYGAFELAVSMRFAGNRTVDEVALCEEGVGLDAIVPAIVWLARRRLMYVDLRGRNIVTDDTDGRFYLVDYDDMVLLEEPATDAETLLREMRKDAQTNQYVCALDLIGQLQRRIEECYSEAAQAVC